MRTGQRNPVVCHFTGRDAGRGRFADDYRDIVEIVRARRVYHFASNRVAVVAQHHRLGFLPENCDDKSNEKCIIIIIMIITHILYDVSASEIQMAGRARSGNANGRSRATTVAAHHDCGPPPAIFPCNTPDH